MAVRMDRSSPVTMDRRRFLAGAAATAVASSFDPRRALASAEGTVQGGKAVSHVVELFTSQGCSSCPPADRYLAELAKRDDVLPLAFHVDYWNYLGWQDTFSSPLWSERQRLYAKRLDAGVYTPQMVIDGDKQAIGSRVDEVETILRDTAPLPAMMSVERGDRLAIRASAPRTAGASAVLHLVWFDRARSVPVARGENAGHTLLYAHVVRDMRMLGMADSEGMTLDLPMSDLQAIGHEACALVLQEKVDGLPGRILAAHEVGEVGTALPAR